MWIVGAVGVITAAEQGAAAGRSGPAAGASGLGSYTEHYAASAGHQR